MGAGDSHTDEIGDGVGVGSMDMSIYPAEPPAIGADYKGDAREYGGISKRRIWSTFEAV